MARHQCDARCYSWRVKHCGWCGEPLVGAFSPKHDGCQERWRQEGVKPVDRNGHSALISEGFTASQGHENTVDRLTLEGRLR